MDSLPGFAQLADLSRGFALALLPLNLLAGVSGCLLGLVTGMLPGIGPAGMIALLLPLALVLPPAATLILLAAVYYGAQYGSGTGAVLLGQPGVSSSAATLIEAQQMVRKGRAGPALFAAGAASFVGGLVATVLLALTVLPLAAWASNFGAAESFALTLLALAGAVALASGSALKAIGMALLGLLLGAIGTGAGAGTEAARFAMGLPEIHNGIAFVALAIGLVVFGDVIGRLARPDPAREITPVSIASLKPSGEEARRVAPAILRGTALGSLLGALPGGGALLGAFAAYTVEKSGRLAAGEVPFGKGNVRGVAGPESANNAGAHTALLPMLAFGLPVNVVMALVVGAVALQRGATGGSGGSGAYGVFGATGLSDAASAVQGSAVLWALVGSMAIGNVLLLLIDLPLVGLWRRLLRVRYRFLFPLLLLAGAVGTYAVGLRLFDVGLLALFGLAGYVLGKLGCELAPLLVGFVLSARMELNLQSALRQASGDWSVFITRPVSAALLAAAVVLLLTLWLPGRKASHELGAAED